MANRFLITGVQLGVLIAMPSQDERQKLADEIQEFQWVGYAENPIVRDVEKVKGLFEEKK